MKPDTDTIIAEILAEHPELASEESSLRALVVELEGSRPNVSVDAAFKQSLRNRLMAEGVAKPKKSAAVLPWWLLYTVPVGITALLLLVVQPESVTAPQAPSGEALYESAPTMMKMEEGAARSMTAPVADEESAMLAPAGTNDFFTAAFTPDRQSLRVSYLTLSAPAYLIVSGRDGVVAQSSLMLPGEHTNLIVPFAGGLVSGAAYEAILYYDNGDGVYTEGFEVMAVSTAGTPVSVTLIAP